MTIIINVKRKREKERGNKTKQKKSEKNKKKVLDKLKKICYNKYVNKGSDHKPLSAKGTERKYTMTNREFYNAIINGEMNDEILTFAKAAVEKLDARNAKRAATPSKAQKENEPIKDAILGVLAAEGVHTASTVGAALEISTSKASALLRQLVADGKVNKIPDVKVDKRKTSVYTLAE